MKALLAILIAACGILLFGFTHPENPLFVKGKLVIHGHNKRSCQFTMLVSGDGKVLAASPVDSTGKFALTFTPANQKSFDFSYVDSHHASDTIYLKSYSDFESDKLDLTFYTFKGYLRVDDDDHVICPKCESPSQVTAIKGLPGYYYCAADRIKF